MALLDLAAIQELVDGVVARERAARATSDPRAQGWRVYAAVLAAQETLATSTPAADPQTIAYFEKVREALAGRKAWMEENDAFNPLTFQLREKSGLDLTVLRQKLGAEDEATRLEAVRTAEELEYREVLDVLKEMLRDEWHPHVISKLVKVVGRLAGEAALEDVIPFYSHPDARVRANAVEGTDGVPIEARFPHLVPLLGDAEPRVRANAVAAIREIGPERFEELLGEMARDENPDHRRSALYVIGSLKTPFAERCLCDMARDEHPRIQERALELLAARPVASSVRAVAALLDGERSEKIDARIRAALEALHPAVPAELRGEVAAALRRLDAPAAEAPAAPGEATLDGLLHQLQTPGDPPPPPALSAADPATQPAAGDDGGDLKKVLARMNAALSALGPRERRAMEKLIKSGKIQNEPQLKREVQRMRNKKKGR